MSVTLNNALNDKIVVTNLGTTKTGLEAFVQTIVDRVLRGDAKGIPDLMKLFARISSAKDNPAILADAGGVNAICRRAGRSSGSNSSR